VAVDSRFGPTLPALLRRAWARGGSWTRLAIAGLAAAVAAAAVYAVIAGVERRTFSYDGPRAPAFELDYEGFERVAPRPGEIARFEHRDGGGLAEAVAVRPLRFRPSPNPVATALPLAADRLAASDAGIAGLQQTLEGRTKLGIMDGRDAYMLAFTAPAPAGSQAGSRLLGKLLLVPEPGDRPSRGIALELMQVSDDERALAAVRDYPAAFFLNWPVNFWLDLAVSVRVPDRLGELLKSFRFA
jgi:hypothetical protein